MPEEKREEEKKEGIKKGTKKTTIVTEEEVEPVSTESIEESEDLRNPGAYNSVVKNWLKKVNPTGEEFTATLYRYDPLNKQRQSVVDERIGEILSMDDIGMSYGSGAYRYLIQIPDGDNDPICRAGKINIDKVYDERRKKAGLVESQEVEKKQNSMLESLELMKSFAEIIKSVMPPPAAPNPDQTAMMLQNFTMMQSVLKKSLLDTSEMYKNMMQEKTATEEEEEEDKPQEGGGMKDLIMPLLDKFMPILLGDTPKAALTAETIKALPEFQKLLKDNQQLKSIIDAVKSEFGQGKTEKVLKKLGIKG
jgi:hypothetical protein